MVHAAPAPQGRIDRTFSCKFEGLTDFIDQLLIDDSSVYAKQRHTVVHTFERLRDERGFMGGEMTVCDDVALQKLRPREVFLSLGHRPGHAQVDFGAAQCLCSGCQASILRTEPS
jgi:hypothetical protein